MESTVYQYRLRNESGRWVADVILRSDGYFSTVSDWGNYAYWWSHPGCEFRAFLARLSPDYLCSKLARREWYDGGATLTAIKERITQGRKDGWLTKERAAEEWKHLQNACLGFWGSDGLNGTREIGIMEFHRFYEATGLDDAGELARYDYPPDVRGFCRNVLPLLAAAIGSELAGEMRTPAKVSSPT